MNRLYLKLMSITIILLMQTSSLNAQVTIGSGNKPSEGALLDLKQNTNTMANSSKGLGLPRVNLTDRGNLYPMFIEDSDYQNNINGKKNEEDASHIGLVVYNLNTDFCEELYPGVQVWDGSKWMPLSKGVFPSETDILIDERDPAKPVQYKVGRFKYVLPDGRVADAGWWMLENLRAEIWPDGNTTDLNISKGLPVQQYTPEHTQARYYYPKYDEEYFLNHPQHGYVYNWHAAARTSTLLEHASEATKGQGICPNGWHLPTQEEWDFLSDIIYYNPCPYAHSKVNDNFGYNMQSREYTPNGASRTTEQGGFDSPLLGWIYFDNGLDENGNIRGLQSKWVGERGIYLSSNKQLSFTLLADQNPTGFWVGNTGFFPIRCKKDDTVKSSEPIKKTSEIQHDNIIE